MAARDSLILPNAGDVWPRRNLGIAENWGRKVEDRVVGAERAILLLDQTMGNISRAQSGRDSTIASQLDVLSTQQEMLAALVENLSLQQSQLTGVVADLATQQQTLSSQQTQLTNLVKALPVTSSHSGSLNGYSIPAGNSNRYTITVNVPSGKTQCSVFAVGQAFFFAPNPPISNADLAGWRVRIQGSDGPWGNIQELNMDGKSTTFMYSRTFSVSSLSAIGIAARTGAGVLHAADAANTSSLFATVTFS